MESDEYNRLHMLPKKLNKNSVFCAANGNQEKYGGQGIFNKEEKIV